MALKKKVARYQQSKEVHGNLSCEHFPHVTVKPEDSYLSDELFSSAVKTVPVFESKEVNEERQQSTDSILASDAPDRPNVPRSQRSPERNIRLVEKRRSKNVQVKVDADAPSGTETASALLEANFVTLDGSKGEGKEEKEVLV